MVDRSWALPQRATSLFLLTPNALKLLCGSGRACAILNNRNTRVPGGALRTVKCDTDVVGRKLFENALEHDGEAINGVRREALCRGKTANRKVRAVSLRHSINDEKEWVLQDHNSLCTNVHGFEA